jgi:hypothetical protein
MSLRDRLKNNIKKSVETRITNDIENISNNLDKGLNNRTKSFFKKQIDNNNKGYSTNNKNQTNGVDSGANVNGQGARIYDNVLHQFATYNTLFTLSGVNEKELGDHSFLTNTVHDVIARSGGIGDPNTSKEIINDLTIAGPQIGQKDTENKNYKDSVRILEQGRDIFFENVNVLSTVGPSEERGLADFARMEFKLHEPYGISFIEKVRAATRLNGYKDYQDAPLLLTIEFKGFDENGIAYKQYGQKGIMVRKIPILITRVEMDVNEGGAIYDVRAVRHQDLAFDDRFKFPRTAISFTASTLKGAADQLANKLNESIEKERDEHKVREVLDKYIIEVDQEVENVSKDYSNTTNSVNNYKGPRDLGKKQVLELDITEATVTSLVSITKLLEDLVRSTNGYEDLATDFWTTYLRRVGFIGNRTDATKEKIKEFYTSGNFEKTITENAFVPWFKIKTSVQTDYSQFDNINKMHRKIITFKVIPHNIPVLKFIRPGVFAKAETMRGAVKKQYNYLYTGANTDVQNLRINYKTAYYMRNTVEVSKGNSGLFEKIDNIISRVIGKENIEDKDVATLRSYPSIIRGRNILQRGDEDNGKEGAKQDFYDYLTNPTVDMMQIEMEILGDPSFICQDQFIPLNGAQQQNNTGGAYDVSQGCFNVDNYSPLIELVYALPDDINEKKTGLMFDTNSQLPEQNLFFAGIYQVVKIESSISNGQFLQTLTCVRLNNQSGLGEDVDKIVKKGNAKFINAVASKDKDDILKKGTGDSLEAFISGITGT